MQYREKVRNNHEKKNSAANHDFLNGICCFVVLYHNIYFKEYNIRDIQFSGSLLWNACDLDLGTHGCYDSDLTGIFAVGHKESLAGSAYRNGHLNYFFCGLVFEDVFCCYREIKKASVFQKSFFI